MVLNAWLQMTSPAWAVRATELHPDQRCGHPRYLSLLLEGLKGTPSPVALPGINENKSERLRSPDPLVGPGLSLRQAGPLNDLGVLGLHHLPFPLRLRLFLFF